jgi:hypothetical protein
MGRFGLGSPTFTPASYQFQSASIILNHIIRAVALFTLLISIVLPIELVNVVIVCVEWTSHVSTSFFLCAFSLSCLIFSGRPYIPCSSISPRLRVRMRNSPGMRWRKVKFVGQCGRVMSSLAIRDTASNTYVAAGSLVVSNS